MAASGAGGRRSSGYVYLVGHCLLVLGYIFFTVGFATDRWLTTDSGNYGLWEVCEGQLCEVAHPGDLAGWMEATRAMQTMALICYLGGVLVSLFLHCVTHTFPPQTCRPLHGKARVLELCTAIGCVFCLIGVSVYGGKGDKAGTLGYSYALSVFSLFLSIPGTAMVAITRNAVSTATSSRITPEQQTGGTSPQSPSAVSYPYGEGRRCPERPPGSDRNSDNPYPYGQGAGLPGAGNPAQSLPYSMYPEEPGNFGTMTMPEPGPIGGGGGGAAPRGPSRGPGRLPPISEVSPSAPPLPPTDGEQPPSYLEAIGHPHS